jgi:hypothetical protein
MRRERESVGVVLPACGFTDPTIEVEVRAMTRRCIGLDVHRDFAQVAIWQDGLVRQAGQIATTPEALRLFADSLAPTDEVALEATGNTHAIVRLLEGRVARVVVSNPQKTRAIAEAKVKTDKVDAAILAQLLAADYLPGVWVADEDTQARRRQAARMPSTSARRAVGLPRPAGLRRPGASPLLTRDLRSDARSHLLSAGRPERVDSRSGPTRPGPGLRRRVF